MKKEIDKLILLLRYYDYNYHVLGKSVIQDEEYDKLVNKLDTMEKKEGYFPPNSPIRNVGFSPVGNNKIIEHDPPMLSVRGSYDLVEIKKVLKDFLQYSDIIMEPKIDGLSVSIIYKNGLLESASLRGDGFKGEDITHHIYYVKNVPIKIDENKECLEIRGEIYVPKNTDPGIEDNNLRNVAAGLLRRKVLPKNVLNFLPYSIPKSQESHENDLIYLGNYCKVPSYKILKNIDNLEEEITSFNNFHFETDGLVFKINNKTELGVTNKFPKNLIAYKFSFNKAVTTIENIEWQMTRNSVLVPVALLKPINLGGANINKVFLHNKKFIIENSLADGAEVEIVRVGNVIPQVKNVTKKSEKITVLLQCPYCKHDVLENKINYICANQSCPEVLFQRLCFFCKNLNFKGLGEERVRRIIKDFNVTNELDFLQTILYTNWQKDLNDKKFHIKKYFSAITPKILLVAIGIPGIGKGTKIHIKDFQELKEIFTTKEFNFLKGKKLEEVMKFANNYNFIDIINIFIKLEED